MSLPPVIIAVNVYNEQLRLPRLLDSIQTQTYPRIKLFVSDNYSTDRTQQILHDFSLNNHTTYVQPQQFLPLQEHLIFMIDTIVSHESSDSLLFFLGADDYFINDQAIEELVRKMRESDKMIVNPIVRFTSPRSRHSRDSRRAYPSNSKSNRLICLSLDNVSTGVQVHHSLMKMEVFKYMGERLNFWYTKDSRRDRNSFAEYMTLWDIVERYAVIKCPRAFFVKEINNRVDSSNRLEVESQHSIGLGQVIRTHYKKNISNFLMIRKRSKITQQTLRLYQFCAFIAFVLDSLSDIETLFKSRVYRFLPSKNS
jgi:glycosyltransferase involved in cell wall biosynthesis